MSKKLYLWVSLSPLILSLVITLIILFTFRFLPPKLPLFSSLPWGDKQLANHPQFLIIPASIALITLINLTLSWQLHESQAFFKNTLLVASIVISLILAIAFAKIVLTFI